MTSIAELRDLAITRLTDAGVATPEADADLLIGHVLELSRGEVQAKAIAGDAQALVERVKSGKGTVGALVMDEALYDDLQEMLRDLKHNPWKFFWKQ